MSETATSAAAAPREEDAEHFDVLIVGAGISGVGAAYHLSTQCPGRRFAVLEAQDGFGGTWRTHRFPGILARVSLIPSTSASTPLVRNAAGHTSTGEKPWRW
jgi:cation diffusion facilitator CzcD-associated flavoprotein CzcO